MPRISDKRVVAPTPAWNVIEYRGPRGLERLEHEWKRLYATMPHRSRYHVYEANRAFVAHLSESPDEIRCLALTDGERVRAICLLEKRVDMTLAHPISTLALPWHPHWLVTDVVCPEDDARRRLIPAVTDHLRRDAPRRQLLRLGPAPKDSVLWDGLHERSPAEYCTSDCAPSYVFDCRVSFNDLESRLQKHFRRNLRSHRKRLLAMEDVAFATITESGQLSEALNTFMLIEASGWKGETGTRSAILLHPHVTAFYRDLTAFNLGEEDRCEINTLSIGGRCIASQFCMRTGRDYTILKICYDEEFASLGPGQLLLEHTIRSCCENAAIERLDLVTDAAWCEDWQPDRVYLQQTHIPLGRWPSTPPIALMRLRFGPGRRVVRWLRSQQRRLKRRDQGANHVRESAGAVSKGREVR